MSHAKSRISLSIPIKKKSCCDFIFNCDHIESIDQLEKHWHLHYIESFNTLARHVHLFVNISLLVLWLIPEERALKADNLV